ncbi:MAG: 4Fe-4S ferredoxin [Deltaproteobacteria bacterium RBG_16_48_10]|nr:MAG: 4Fe-4S ferredoxin [Deltaproteobacteria bacterium RBG_16_48_10]
MADKVGAVMVVGGGIAGIQASLDLAESGYYVYLVEASPAIGGVMAQLDKTFPTNDCSMCILSPKLVEAGRHLNIQTLTYSEVMKVEGQPGDFEITVRKKPRYIDPLKCTGCGECPQACPVHIKSQFDEGLVDRRAIYRPYAQAFPNIFTIEKGDRAPCGLPCPAGINVQGYVALTAVGKYKEALSLIWENLPLPGVLGRICPHPCEKECNRKELDEPIAICELKRFLADQVKTEIPIQKEEAKEGRVAIVGSGPAGLAASAFLAQKGYPVTIFEALPVMGGMLYAGIPSYRLPRGILENEIKTIRSLGVEIKTNSPIGSNLTVNDLFKQGYRAVFLAVGAHQDQKMNVPGEENPRVIPGVVFLRKANLDQKVEVGEQVAVIGGGNVAIDAARTALRMGAKEVTIIYRRSRNEMPAYEEDIEEADEEGIKFQFLATPTEVISKDGKVTSLRCIRMELGEPDASGRRRPIPIQGSDFSVEVDTIIPAIGQTPDLSFMKGMEIETTPQGTIKVDPVTLKTSKEGVFAGGDAVSGPWIAIEAVAAGKEAAISIDRYLRGQDLCEGRPKPKLEKAGFEEIYAEQPKAPREQMEMLPPEERQKTFLEVKKGFTEEQAKREALRCLNCGLCSECLQCVALCKAGAVNHQMKEEMIKFKVGSVILSPGFDEYDPGRLIPYGYGRFPNVISSIQFERILSASGPFQGNLLRPSDRKAPKKVAWIQCAGSRDMTGNDGNEYCSSVCCMYAIKEAVIAKEHHHEVEPTIFYMDIRAHGKDFDAYYERAKREYGVRFIRSMVSRVAERPKTKNLMITYIDSEGRVKEEEFELVVLSVGLTPSKGAKELAQKLGLQLDPYGFCKTEEFSPLCTSQPGIYVCGAFQGPKDIPETVAQASGAVSAASGLLSDVRGTLTKKKDYPEEVDVRGQEPRIGVFVCHCGINIGGVVNVQEVKDYAKTLEGVAFVEENLYTCSQDTQEKIKKAIQENQLNRVVVASCSPRTHEPMFQETIREMGLNKYLFEMTNIRDQCSWVHMHQPKEATEKAKELLRMAVAKSKLLQPLKEPLVEVIKKGLIIGGGLAGMRAALELARQGLDCALVEKEAELGGNLRHIYHTIEGNDPQALLRKTINEVLENPRIQVFTRAELKNLGGYVGNFKSIISTNGSDKEFEHGVVIVAVGAKESIPTEYLYGQDSRVITQKELEERIAFRGDEVSRSRHIVMIQCVGSRTPECPNCSRICCSVAVKNALKIKGKNPETKVTILYRDIRTYGLMERYYTQARNQGIEFIQYELDAKPDLSLKEGGLQLKVKDKILGEEIILQPDLVVLASAIVPYENEALAKMLKVPLTTDGFFLEAHMKLRPVDFATDGIFLAGMAHFPKSITESISQADAAVARATASIAKGYVSVLPTISEVDQTRCVGCGLCELLCPFSAIRVVETEKGSKAETIAASCKGCGVCSASCTQKAVTVHHFTDEQLTAQIEALLPVEGKKAA